MSAHPTPLQSRLVPRRLALGALAWLVPAALVWIVLTPAYNRFLTLATERLMRLSESPPVTRLVVYDRDHLLVTRTDTASARGHLASIRTTDTHFPVVLLAALFLAVPGIGWRRRLENLGWALLVAAFFHLLSLFFYVKFIYATQLGAWSAARYGPFAANFWGLGKHLLDLPFKLALPLLLWAAFYLRLLLPPPRGLNDADPDILG